MSDINLATGQPIDHIGYIEDDPMYNQGLVWHLSSNPISSTANSDWRLINYGTVNDLPVVGDWDGDEMDSIGVVQNDFTWALVNHLPETGNATVDQSTTFSGGGGILPVTGDWTNAGLTSPGGWDPTIGIWHLDVNTLDDLVFFEQGDGTYLSMRWKPRISRPYQAVFTSPNTATFTEGIAGSFTVTATGAPAPIISMTCCSLPSGVTFSNGVLSGTPAVGTAGTYSLTFVASNGVEADATQGFTLTVYSASAPTPTSTSLSTMTPISTNTPTSILIPTDIPTTTPVPTDIPTQTLAPTPIPTLTPIPTDVPTQTLAPTAIPTLTPIPTEIPTQTVVPTTFSTLAPIPTETPTQTVAPTASGSPQATTTPGLVNVALNKAASQSSTYPGSPAASVAVDSNVDGNYADGSVIVTNADVNAWWQVDLGASYSINGITLWNRTDCCAVSNVYLLVSDVPFTSTGLSTTLAQPGVSGFMISGTVSTPSLQAINRTGRYVRVQLTTTDYLSLAEVEVWAAPQPVTPLATPTVTATLTPTPNTTPGLMNVALNKAASQSSTYPGSPAASVAVDGNVDGNYADGSVTATNADTNAWWQVDLGASYSINGITLWNRTDCCASRLSNFYVLVSDAPFTSPSLSTTLTQPGVSSYLINGTAGTPTLQTINRTGRYVRVQLTTTDYLSLAEVEVWAAP